MSKPVDAYVVGAGVAGAFAALELRRMGLRVTLIDAWDPGHSRATSSDHHRLLRFSHGNDEFYTQWARDSRVGWLELEKEVGYQLYVQSGVVVLAAERETEWADASARVLTKLGISHFIAPAEELPARLPVVNTKGFAYGLWELESGFVYAKSGVLAAISVFEKLGGKLERGRVTTDGDERPHLDGSPLRADVIVMACGPWMGDLFPKTLRPHLTVVRQDIIYVAPPAGDTRYDWQNMPAWIDHSYPAYGVPAADGHGFKAAIAWHQSEIDLEAEDRVVDATAMARSRRYLATRFPGLERQAIVDQKVCQLTNTVDLHWVIDRHPQHANIVFFGGGSGHLFKHGPVAGRFVAGFAAGKWETPDRFKVRTRSVPLRADNPQ